MNRNQFDKTERGEVTEDDFEAALRTVFLAPEAASPPPPPPPLYLEVSASLPPVGNSPCVLLCVLFGFGGSRHPGEGEISR